VPSPTESGGRVIARCGCVGGSCTCLVESGPGVAVSGAGSSTSPYVIASDSGQLGVADTSTVNLTLGGDGSSADPYVLSAAATLNLDALTDVQVIGTPATGRVLAYDGTKWAPAPPSTVTTGAIHVGNGITGDGSSGLPLTAVVDPVGHLTLGAAGLALSSADRAFIAGLTWNAWTHAWRIDSGTAVTIGAGSVLVSQYARWGQLCFLDFSWVGGSGWNGRNGAWVFTVPFPAKGPGRTPIPAFMRTKDASWWAGQGMIYEHPLLSGSTGSADTDMRLIAPIDSSTARMAAARAADTTGANGTGVPLIGGTRSFDATDASMITIQGWYRVADGF
jgi:hypothetical protein